MYSNNLIIKILDYIEININNKITIEELENHYFYNRFYIMKLFKKELNITIFDYINKLRIFNSLELFYSNEKIIKIALRNGFYSLEYYSEIFKKEIGISPREYKRIILSNYYDQKRLKITNNLIKLNNIIGKINKYKQNKKPEQLPVKKLSIWN